MHRPHRPGPLALLVSGPPASGKSTLSRALAARLGAALLDLDSLTGALTQTFGELLGTDDLDAAPLIGTVRAARYEGLLAAAEDTLRVGTPAVLVAPFSSERAHLESWAGVRARLTAAGGRPRLVWLRLDPDELSRRLVSRGAVRDAAKLADPAAFLARHPLHPPAVEHVAVDATATLARQVAVVLDATAGRDRRRSAAVRPRTLRGT